MSLRISTNSAASQIVRELQGSSAAERASVEKLASGQRIRSAGDDAAGLSISEKDRAQIRSLNQGTRNAHDAVSLVQVMEGAMNETTNILIRMRELSIQAASDTVGNAERSMADREYQQLHAEIARISESTEMNGVKLLDQFANYLQIQTGANGDPNNDRTYIDLRNFNTEPQRLGTLGSDVRTRENARNNLDRLDTALEKLGKRRAGLGAIQNRIQTTIANNMTYSENLTGARSRVRDVDMADQTAEMTRAQIQGRLQTSLLSQANTDGNLALKLLG